MTMTEKEMTKLMKVPNLALKSILERSHYQTRFVVVGEIRTKITPLVLNIYVIFYLKYIVIFLYLIVFLLLFY